MTIHDFLNLNYTNNAEGRYARQIGDVVKFLAKKPEGDTIPVIAKGIKSSVPTVTKLVNDLKENEFIVEVGKRNTESFGRKPLIYTVNREKFYVVGVAINLKKIQLNVYDITLNSVYGASDRAFVLSDTIACREEVLSFIQTHIKKSGIKTDAIIGVGVALTGRVNGSLGKSYNFLTEGDCPFGEYLNKHIELPVFLENDTRAIGLAEQYCHKSHNISNGLIINIGRGIGMSIMAYDRILVGGDGFAGEFGHMQFVGNQGKLCICGKRGCLDTEVSGKALEDMYRQSIKDGEKSICEESQDGSVHYDEIIKAANKGDGLCISLLQKQGKILGEALGNIINLLNPEYIIISGKYGKVGAFFVNAVQSGMYLAALSDTLSKCKVITSSINADIETFGAGSLVLKKLELI
ncbi:ROK family protein [Marinilabiliaceae bacterium JC017]|nr:ROK family protein [Marinilabiliaceae bacterium JC017]